MMIIVMMMKVEEEEEDDEVDEDDVWQEEREEREPLLGQRDEKEPLFGRSRGSPSRRLHSMDPVRLSLITNSLSDTNTMPTHTTTPIKCC